MKKMNDTLIKLNLATKVRMLKAFTYFKSKFPSKLYFKLRAILK